MNRDPITRLDPQRLAPTHAVVTHQGDDPYVAGGVPVAVFCDEETWDMVSDAWDYIAERSAVDASDWWYGRPGHLRNSRTTRDGVVLGMAARYEVHVL